MKRVAARGRGRGRLSTILTMIVAVILTACGSGSPSSSGSGQQATTPSASSASPTPSISVAFFRMVPGSNSYFRFAASIMNPESKTIAGMVVTWTAYDSAGAIVGSRPHHCPLIGANSTQTYVGGAGSISLSGVPARVSAVITDPGHFVDTPASPFPVTSVQFSQASAAFQAGFDPTAFAVYEVTGDVTIGGSVSVQPVTLDIPITLTDSNSKIVGADFYQPTNLSVPLTPGTKFRVDDYLAVTATPSAASIAANVDPAA